MKAPIGRRITAFLIDETIAGVIVIFFGVLGFTALTVVQNTFVGLLGLLIILFGLMASVAFNLVKDALFSGRGVGKKFMRLRVVKSDGSTCDYVSSALRNITIIIPFIGVIELILPLTDSQGYRMGDKIAKTQVVE